MELSLRSKQKNWKMKTENEPVYLGGQDKWPGNLDRRGYFRIWLKAPIWIHTQLFFLYIPTISINVTVRKLRDPWILRKQLFNLLSRQIDGHEERDEEPIMCSQ